MLTCWCKLTCCLWMFFECIIKALWTCSQVLPIFLWNISTGDKSFRFTCRIQLHLGVHLKLVFVLLVILEELLEEWQYQSHWVTYKNANTQAEVTPWSNLHGEIVKEERLFPHHFGKGHITPHSQEDDYTGCDEVSKCTVLQLRAAWEKPSALAQRFRKQRIQHAKPLAIIFIFPADGLKPLCVWALLARAQIMEKAANVPAKPCPLIMGVV